MITTHALTAKLGAINRMGNAAITAIHNEQVQRVSRGSSIDDGDFSDIRRSTNLYKETVKRFGPSGTTFGRYSAVAQYRQ